MTSSNSELCSYIFANEHHPCEECLLPSSELKSFTPEINETEKYEIFLPTTKLYDVTMT